MIIECENCNKKFDIDQNLIPEKGRLLLCSSCNHKWFFKKITAVKIKELPINESIEIFETKNVDESNDKEINDKASIINKIDPSTAFRALETSYEKSMCPGVSIRLRT